MWALLRSEPILYCPAVCVCDITETLVFVCCILSVKKVPLPKLARAACFIDNISSLKRFLKIFCDVPPPTP